MIFFRANVYFYWTIRLLSLKKLFLYIYFNAPLITLAESQNYSLMLKPHILDPLISIKMRFVRKFYFFSKKSFLRNNIFDLSSSFYYSFQKLPIIAKNPSNKYRNGVSSLLEYKGMVRSS